ncbi:MAG: hypothetical protein MI806_04025 [Minwuiales bacterium]|nr:hypothetical protein [Minwuiales bacterium]
MNELLGSSLGVFLGVTVMLMGFCAAITGQAIANTWRPMWQIFPYCILLGGADRFLHFSLFGGDLLSVSGFLIDTAVLIVLSLIAYRATLARKMASQYPWIYERSGPFSWRQRSDG